MQSSWERVFRQSWLILLFLEDKELSAKIHYTLLLLWSVSAAVFGLSPCPLCGYVPFSVWGIHAMLLLFCCSFSHSWTNIKGHKVNCSLRINEIDSANHISSGFADRSHDILSHAVMSIYSFVFLKEYLNDSTF